MIRDQLGNKVSLRNPPQRIVSLVPSQTELLYTLGLEKEVAGITSFCIHPSSWKFSKTIVGGTKKLQLDVIDALQPDLIIANKEENDQFQVETLQKKYPVYTSNIATLHEAYQMIADVGSLTNCRPKADALIQQIRDGFNTLAHSSFSLRSAYLIWRKPYMTIGGDTFIHSVLNTAGFNNVFRNEKRYPVITTEDLKRQDTQLLLLSSEPFPFREHHAAELKLLLPNVKIHLVDGELFSWYGSRLLHTSAYINQLKHLFMSLPD